MQYIYILKLFTPGPYTYMHVMYSCHTFLQGPGKCLVFRFISIILYYLKKDSQETIPETESLAGGSQDLFLNSPASVRNDRTDEISKILYIA